MVHIRHWCSHHCQLNLCPTVAWRLVSWYRRNSVKCMQPGGESLLHVGICCKLLVSHFLLKGSIDTEWLGLILLMCGWLWWYRQKVMVVQAEGYGGTGGRLWTTLPTFPTSSSLISVHLDQLQSTNLARNLTPVSSMLGHKPGYHGGTKV
jgi:hypothetical protein